MGIEFVFWIQRGLCGERMVAHTMSKIKEILCTPIFDDNLFDNTLGNVTKATRFNNYGGVLWEKRVRFDAKLVTWKLDEYLRRAIGDMTC